MSDWTNIEQLFLEAAELQESERGQFLAKACADRPDWLSEVESLLAFDGQNTRSFVNLVEESAAHLVGGEALVGRRIGAYKITEVLGHGGMGAVYLATRADDQFSKKVAIKFIRGGMDSPAVIDRFLRERQILANLDHPYIAKLLDGGTTEDRIPYFVMEYVSGTPVHQWCSDRKLSLEAKCELFRKVCEAVSYAHRNLVVHRDLKPTNILVTKDGTPVLLDFGIAKLVDDAAPADLTHTAGTWVLTPDYASPEQVRGLPTTTASDVYSLGILLYQILTGSRPYKIETTSPIEVERTVCEQQPPRPSSVDNNRKLSGDLDNIVLMALRKEPERRYSSVDQFSEDVHRYMRGLPVLAREDTFGYRSSKFVRRNGMAVVAASITLSALVAGIISTAHEARVAEQQRTIAVAERNKAERQKAVAESEHFTADQQRDVASRASAVAIARATEAEAEKLNAHKRMGDLVKLANTALFDVESTLEHVNGTLDARRDVITSTLKYLDGLSAESKDNPEIMHLLVVGYIQSGDVLGIPMRANLGDREGALRAWAKARQVLTELNRVEKPSLSSRLDDLGLHQRVGIVLEAQGLYGAAMKEYRAALAIAHQAGREKPADQNAVAQTGMIEHTIGTIFVAQHDYPAAADHFREEIRAYQRSVDLDPANLEYVGPLGVAISSYGQTLVMQNHVEEGLQEFRRSLAIREGVLAKTPDDLLTKTGIARLHLRIGAALGAMWQPSLGDPVAAVASMEKALAAYEQLYAADPSNRKGKADLANALVYTGAVDPNASVAVLRLERAIAMLKELRAADPKQVSYVSDFNMAVKYLNGKTLSTEAAHLPQKP